MFVDVMYLIMFLILEFITSPCIVSTTFLSYSPTQGIKLVCPGLYEVFVSANVTSHEFNPFFSNNVQSKGEQPHLVSLSETLPTDDQVPLFLMKSYESAIVPQHSSTPTLNHLQHNHFPLYIADGSIHYRRCSDTGSA